MCADELRSRRAVEEYAQRGVGLDVVATAARLKLGKAKALVIDIGRNPVDGIALAKKIDESDAAVHLFVAGVRDADQKRQLREPAPPSSSARRRRRQSRRRRRRALIK